MKCRECGKPMETRRVDVYPYTESGLSNVVLRNLSIRECPEGHRVVSIPQMPALHRTLAVLVAKQRPRLLGEQVRFLRKYLGLSGVDFARTIDVSPESVSRWENDRERMSMTTERLIRLMVLHGSRVEEYPISDLAEVGRGEEGPRGTVAVTVGAHGWEATGAAA